MQITKRIDLNLGYTCNIQCRFCYYQVSMRDCDKEARRDLTTHEAKRWLRFFRQKGLEAVDLTGGEPTIRKDIEELIRYAHDIGYKKICVISNGLMLSDVSFARRLVEAGLNDVLLSLHGPNAVIHENLTQAKGSFDKLIAAIKNMIGLGLRCRTNTVVNGVSYKYIEETAGLLCGLGVKVVNFILFNPIVEAQGSSSDMNVSYTEAAPYIKTVIEEYRDKMDKIAIRYIPFCLMQGYEGYVTNIPQIQYDSDEWDYYWRTYFRNGPFLWAAALCLGFLVHPAPSRLAKSGFNIAKHEAVKWALAFKNKTKGPQCGKCRCCQICDGLWRDYAKKMGFSELIPIHGKKLNDPVFFMAKNSQYGILV